MEQKSSQSSIKEGTQQEKDEERTIPEGRKEIGKKPPPPLRRVKGRLSKKEQVEMKKKHRDIAWLLAPPPTQETVNHEKAMASEAEKMDIVDENREERL